MGQHKSSRSLKLTNWRLSYKLAVVLAIPLIAAIALGGLRVSTQLDEARRFSTLTEQMAIIPALHNFSSIVIMASTTSKLNLSADVTTPDEVTAAVSDVQRNSATSNLDPAITANLARLLTDGKSLYNSIRGGPLPPEELEQRTVDFLIRCEAMFRTLFALTENTEVMTDGANMLNANIASRWMLDQTNALGIIEHNPEAARITARNAINIERSTLALLRNTALDTGQIDRMLGQIDERLALINDLATDAASGGALFNNLFNSHAPYQEMNSASTARIATTLDRLTSDARTAAIRDSLIVAAILALAVAVVLLVARALSVPIQRLRDGTLAAAHRELPAAIAAVKDGADVTTVELAPINVHTDEEIGELARAVDSMNSEALRLAGEQAHLRQQISTMLETLARRNRTLVEQQLSLIDALEYEEKDPIRLQNLFALDHLAARMRRTGDSLLVLSGTRPRARNAPAPLSDILRGAVSQVENYQRVHIGRTPHGYLAGAAVSDVVHLLAELVDNALRASPPNSTVYFEFSHAVGSGLLLEIADSGIGTSSEVLDEINTRLAAGDTAEIHAPRQMGLFVVGRLASRNGISVRLRPTFDSDTNAGITASVYFPATLLNDVHHALPEPVTERPRRLHRPDDSALRVKETSTPGLHHPPVRSEPRQQTEPSAG